MIFEKVIPAYALALLPAHVFYRIRSRDQSMLIAGILASTAAAMLAGCGSKDEQIEAPRAVMTAELVSPSRQTWPDTLSASGEVAPWQEAIVGAEVAGVRLEKVQVNVGDKVRKGQLLAQYDEATLRADLAALDASVAEAITLARLRSGSVVMVNNADGKVISASLRQLAPTVNTRTRNGIAYVDLPADSGLAAGMYVSGRFMLAARYALVIPESALVLRDGNKYLMQVDAAHHAWEIKVETGRRSDDLIEILGAIDPAARFVKAGGAFVSNGDLVQIADARSSQ